MRTPMDPAAQPTGPIEMVIEGRARDLGGFSVRRVLPWMRRRQVGPFVFFDHMGPVQLAPGGGMDVRPHPHIGLATVTYLFAGEILHRDSLGTEQMIRPGDVNWMVAGRGIVHSERTPAALRAAGTPMHGLQLWVALPIAQEEGEPSFTHTPASALPSIEVPGARLRIVAGTAFGVTSPVRVNSPTLYVDATLDSGAEWTVPGDTDECAVYVVQGELDCMDAKTGAQANPSRMEAGQMAVLHRRATILLRALSASRVVVIGGAALEGERHIWWNFVSSSKERIERAKLQWKEGRFPKVPGDEIEFTPLPE